MATECLGLGGLPVGSSEFPSRLDGSGHKPAKQPDLPFRTTAADVGLACKRLAKTDLASNSISKFLSELFKFENEGTQKIRLTAGRRAMGFALALRWPGPLQASPSNRKT